MTTVPVGEEQVGRPPVGRAPAHRPSRRDHVVRSAVTVFAARGYGDASVADVAEEAGMAATAVYYHFTGKEALFEAAMQLAFDSISEAVEGIRATGVPAGSVALNRVLAEVWRWNDTHPEEAQLINYQLPGATPRAQELRRRFEEDHVVRAFDYTKPSDDPGGPNPDGAAALAVRTFVRLAIDVHLMRAADGPLSTSAATSLRDAHRTVSARILNV